MWPRIGSSLPREAVRRLCLEATPEQPRRVREDTSRYVRCRLSCLRAGTISASIRRRAALSLGRVQADPSSGGNLGAVRRVSESRLSWRLSAYQILPRGNVVPSLWIRGNPGTATPSARLKPLDGSVARCASFGRWQRRRGAEGNFRTASGVQESRLSWCLDACRCPLGDSEADPEPWSHLRGCHVLRESKICACRGLDACCVFFGTCRTAPSPGLILQCCHAPCDDQPFATPAHPAPSGVDRTRGRVHAVPLSLLREVRCDPVHPDRRPDLLREVWTMRRVDASLRTGPLSRDSVQRLSADGNQTRRKTNAVPSCKRQPATPTAELAPCGCTDRLTETVQWTTCKDPGPHEVGSVASILRAARSAESVAESACGYVAGPLDRSLLPDPSLVYGVSASRSRL